MTASVNLDDVWVDHPLTVEDFEALLVLHELEARPAFTLPMVAAGVGLLARWTTLGEPAIRRLEVVPFLELLAAALRRLNARSKDEAARVREAAALLDAPTKGGPQ